MAYADDKEYVVSLARPVKYAGRWIRPDQSHWMLGRAINELEAAPENSGALLVGAEVMPVAPMPRLPRPSK